MTTTIWLLLCGGSAFTGFVAGLFANCSHERAHMDVIKEREFQKGLTRGRCEAQSQLEHYRSTVDRLQRQVRSLNNG
jgi:polyhydroxyalkanoate synthesis regulator phasin